MIALPPLALHEEPVKVYLDTEGPLEQARTLGELRFILDAGYFIRHDDAAQALLAWLLAPAAPDVVRPHINEAHVTIGQANVRRRYGERTYVVEVKQFGFVDVLYECDTCGVYRERVSARQCIPTHIHKTLDESELILSDGLLLQGKPVPAGSAHSWPKGFAHRYDNPTQTEHSFICIDRPRFVPTDEIEVDLSSAALQDRPPTRYF